MKISAVVNTHNEASNIARCLRSVQPYVDEIVVVDMESTDKTTTISRSYTKKIWKTKNVGYVEPARNFAISKAIGDWVILLDADEVVTEEFGLKLRRLADHADYSYYRIPRKNMIFNQWMRHSGWWPDYQIRFFQKNAVSWTDEIHSIPITQGKGMDLPAEEKNALVHHNYQTLEQFIERLNRYTTQQAKEKVKNEEKYNWRNIISSPVQEFITRYFVWEGYKDGIHGLALSLLQAFSMLVVELKVWQFHSFPEEIQVALFDEVNVELNNAHKDVMYWYFHKKSETAGGSSKIVYKLRSKLKV